nr:hypothetical protein [Luteimonas sp. XNQY3]
MAVRDYLQPANAGNQMWQMLASNFTPGPHPYKGRMGVRDNITRMLRNLACLRQACGKSEAQQANNGVGE